MTTVDFSQPVAPLVSVIMPTYNNRSVIEEAIRSISDQTLHAWELIIVDDASTDGTAEFVESNFADPRIRLIRMESNSGSGACRNLAISVARGEYIAVMDADDISLPERLSMQVSRFLARPELGAISAQVLEFGRWGGPVIGKWPTERAVISARQKAQKMPIPHPAAMFRREVIVGAGSYDIACRRAQDYGLFLNLAEVELEMLKEPLVRYRTERPISLGYVIRNESFAELARLRYALKSSGARVEDLPVVPKLPLSLYVKSLKSWAVRNFREQLQLLAASRNSGT